jgi:8-oxo-dGTP diphosphatase
MEDSLQKMFETFGGKLRVRALGLCLENNKMLLCKHTARTSTGYLWGAIGGGVDFGEALCDALVREWHEEANVEIEVEKILFLQEYIQNPLHAIEIFFEVKIKNNQIPTLGIDTELPKNQQVLNEIAWFSVEDIKKIPNDSLQKGLFVQENWRELWEKKTIF